MHMYIIEAQDKDATCCIAKNKKEVIKIAQKQNPNTSLKVSFLV